MYLKRLTTAAIAASITAGSLAPLSTSAFAGEWGNRHGYQYGNGHDWRVANDRRWRGFETYRNPYRDHHAWRDHDADRRSDRKERKEIARGVAIGLGVLMLGLIASEAGRGDHYDRYDY